MTGNGDYALRAVMPPVLSAVFDTSLAIRKSCFFSPMIVNNGWQMSLWIWAYSFCLLLCPSTSALSTGPGTHGIIIDYGLRYGDGDSWSGSSTVPSPGSSRAGVFTLIFQLSNLSLLSIPNGFENHRGVSHLTMAFLSPTLLAPYVLTPGCAVTSPWVTGRQVMLWCQRAHLPEDSHLLQTPQGQGLPTHVNTRERQRNLLVTIDFVRQ